MLETPRLIVREILPGDAPAILQILNDPAFLRFVGDKGVRTVEDARAWIATGPAATRATHGYGLGLVTLKPAGEPMGICGLVRREWLPGPDLGFSLLPGFWSQGYAREAAETVLADATRQGHRRILAIVDAGNQRSIRLLRRLGFEESGLVRNPAGEALGLYARAAPG